MAKTPTSYKAISDLLWGATANGALDAQKLACLAIGRGAAVVVLGPEGEVLSSGSDPEKGQMNLADGEKTPVPWAELKKGIEPNLKKGLFADLEIPSGDGAKAVLSALHAGQLASAANMLASIQDSNAQLGPFKKELVKRLDELQAKKKSFFESLVSAGKKWEAYKVGQSYTNCFPKAKDLSDVKKKVSELSSDAEVRKNVDGQRLLMGVLSMAYSEKPTVKDKAAAKAALEKVGRDYPGTEAAGYASTLANLPAK